jgi:hypothetical protein
MALAEEAGHPGINPRMITRARDSQASRSMEAEGSASKWSVAARRADYPKPVRLIS